MPPSENQNMEVHECIFSANIVQAQVGIKIPCKMLVTWENASHQEITKTQNENVALQNGKADFHEFLSFKTFMLFNKKEKKYERKTTHLVVFSISTKKLQKNMLGRISIQLSDVINEKFGKEEKRQLQFGGVKNRFLTFSVLMAAKKNIQKKPNTIPMNKYQVVAEETFSKEKKTDHIEEKPKEQKLPSPKNLDGQMEMPKPPHINKNFSEDSNSYSYIEKAAHFKRLEEENTKLFEMVEQLNEELSKEKKQKQKYEQEVQLIQKQSSQMEKEKSHLENDFNEKFKKQTEKKIQIQNELKQSEKLRFEYETQNFQLKYELSNIKEDFQVKEQELNLKTQLIKNLQSEVNQLKLQLKSNQKSNLNEFNISYNILQQEKNKLKEHLMAMQADRDTLEKRINDLQKRNKSHKVETDLEQKLALIHTQAENLKQSLEEYEKEKKNLEEKINFLEGQNVKLKKKQSDESNKIMSKGELTLKLKDSEIAKLNQKLHEKIEENKKRESDIKKMQINMKKLESQFKQISKQKENQESLKKEINVHFNEMNKIRTQLTNKNLILENEKQTLTLKNYKIQKQLKEKEEILRERKHYTEVLSKQIQEEIRNNQDLEEKITKFAEKQLKMRENIMTIEEQAKKIYQILMEKEQSQQTKNQILGSKSQELLNTQKLLNQKMNQIEEMSNQINNLKKQLYQAKLQAVSNGGSAQNLKNQRIEELEKERKEIERISKQKIEEIELRASKIEKQKEKIEKQLIESLRKEKEDLQKNNEEMIQRNKWLQLNIREFEEKIFEKQKEITKALNANSHQIHNLQNQQAILLKENKRLSKELQQYENKIFQQNEILNSYIEKFSGGEMPKIEDVSIKQFSLKKLSEILKDLKELIGERKQHQNTIQLLVTKISSMHKESQKAMQERRMIQEKSRKLSMEMQKIKAYLLKGKGNISQKKQLIISLKPCEGIVKELTSLAENLSELQFETELE